MDADVAAMMAAEGEEGGEEAATPPAAAAAAAAPQQQKQQQRQQQGQGKEEEEAESMVDFLLRSKLSPAGAPPAANGAGNRAAAAAGPELDPRLRCWHVAGQPKEAVGHIAAELAKMEVGGWLWVLLCDLASGEVPPGLACCMASSAGACHAPWRQTLA